MNIVISGYGKMGHEIENLLRETGIIPLLCTEDIRSVDKAIASKSVCIDFTEPEAFLSNYEFIAENFLSAVIGTTGWGSKKNEIIESFLKNETPMIYASNFSIGLNIFFKLNEIASKLTSALGKYHPYILEMHHAKKLDSPSGTARTIVDILGKNFSHIPTVASVRSGSIPGIHQVGYESEDDRMSLVHEAFSRKVFARGAILAAEWSLMQSGVFEFRELIENNFNKIIGIC